MGRSFGGECTLLPGPEVLGMLHLHEEEFQVLAGHVLIGREEVRPVTLACWLCDYLQGGEGRGSHSLHRLGHAGPEQGGRQYYSC